MIGYRMAVDAEPRAIGSALYAAHYSAWACDWVQGEDDARRMAQALELVELAVEGQDRLRHRFVGKQPQEVARNTAQR